MRLLNVHTLEFCEYFEADVPPYFILSHRWGNNELSYKQYRKGVDLSGPGYQKIVDYCSFVRDRQIKKLDRDDHYKVEWVWIDTICIDKRSSAELSEAINSMYKWYEKAEECIVYLADITAPSDRNETVKWLGQSTWFSRGWTLQGLLAPDMCVFVDQSWTIIGHVCATPDVQSLSCSCSSHVYGPPMFHAISRITLIAPQHLKRNPYSGEQRFCNTSIAQRMSWASRRYTTRPEDMAYCLLGIFGVNMPLLYGEGRKAFFRFQEEIMKRSNDQSIFAWKQPIETESMNKYGWVFTSVLAESPRQFETCGSIASTPGKFAPDNSLVLTNKGLQIEATAIPVPWKKLEEISVRDGRRLMRFQADIGQVILLPLNCYDAMSGYDDVSVHDKPVPCVLPLTRPGSRYQYERIHFADDLTRGHSHLAEDRNTKHHFTVDVYGGLWKLTTDRDRPPPVPPKTPANFVGPS